MNNQEPIYLSEKALAKIWSIAPKTLQKWRWKKIGPPYVKIGIAVRYVPESIRKFEEERTCLTGNKICPSCLNNSKIKDYEPK